MARDNAALTRERYARMTPEERRAPGLRWRARLSPERAAEMKERARVRNARYRAEMTPEKREELRLRRAARHTADPTASLSMRLARRDGKPLDGDSKAMLNVLICDPCAYCGEPAATMDHIDPDGDSHWTNLAAACQSCNAKKYDTSLLRGMLAMRIREERDLLDDQLRLLDRRSLGLAPS